MNYLNKKETKKIKRPMKNILKINLAVDGSNVYLFGDTASEVHFLEFLVGRGANPGTIWHFAIARTLAMKEA